MKIFQFFDIPLILCLGNVLLICLNPLGLLALSNPLGPDPLHGLSPFVQTLLHSFARPLKDLPLPAVREQTLGQLTRAADSLNLPNPENDTCAKNYGILCPENWTDVGDGQTCLGPIGYVGPCPKRLDLKNATPLGKYNYEVTCNVDWPCLAKCVPDYSKPCPDQWVPHLEGSCHAPKSYKGQCVRSKNFDKYGEADKRLWAETCDVQWACVEKRYDFSFLCPTHWSMNPDERTCKAPPTYLGPCPTDLYLSNVTDVEKVQLMQQCDIQWPTHGTSVVFDLDSICPIGWKVVSLTSQTCEAPVSYSGPCDKVTSFQFYNKEEKYQFSKMCDAPWKSVDEKMQNFHLSCPYRWTLVDDSEQLCLAPVEYQGPCATLFSFQGYSVEMKAAWAGACATGFLSDSSHVLSVLNGHRTVPISGGARGTRIRGGRAGERSNGFIKLSDAEGPIGIPDSVAHGRIVPVHEQIGSRDRRHTEGNGEVVNVSYKAKLNNRDFDNDEVVDLSDMAQLNNKDFVVSDEKIRELTILKEASEDVEFRRTVDETIADLKKRNAKLVPFAFIQLHQINSDEVIEESIDIVKNLLNNYKIEKGNSSYDGSCAERDYSKCPVGWTPIKNLCMAPKSYIRSQRKCQSILNITGMNKKVYDVSHDIMIDMVDVQARQKLEIECRVTFPCKECVRDTVRVHCPLGWTYESKEEICRAPADYPQHLRKLCGDSVSFRFATPTFKRNWAYICKSDWPCVSVCEKNYGAPCPVGYDLINRRTEHEETVHVCVNESQRMERMENADEPFWTRDVCSVIEVIHSMSVKIEIERECKVQWPCLDKCEEDYYQACPYDWIYHDNKCVAPFHYLMPLGCVQTFDVTSFSTQDKFLFSIKCLAPWPCKDSCQPDLRGACPRDWQRVRLTRPTQEDTSDIDGAATESVGTDGASTESVGTESVGTDGASTESVGTESVGTDGASTESVGTESVGTDSFGTDSVGAVTNEPDEESLRRTHESLSKQKEEQVYTCRAPETYEGPCDDVYNFDHMTFLQKQDFMFRCKVQWPCGKSIHKLSNWQRPEIYRDRNFEKLESVRFSDPYYLVQYDQYMQSFFF